MLEAAILGTALGIVAGLTPGIHSNTFAALILLYAASFENAGVIVICSAISYTIADIVPTTILGVPDEETAVGAFPAHEMVLDGRAFEAISLSALSSFLALLLSIPLFFTVLAISSNYDYVRLVTPYILLLISAFLILSERAGEFEGSLASWRKRLYAFLVFSLSGFAGVVAFNNSHLAEVNPAGSVLLPLLTGLFGAPILMQSLGGKIPDQILTIRLPDMNSAAKGALSGFFVSLFPGISSGIATAIASFSERKREGYIAAMSAANTSNALLCLFMLMAMGKTRSGAADILKRLAVIPTFQDVILLSLISGLVSLAATLVISYLVISKIRNVSLLPVSVIVFVFLILIVYIFTGFFGLAIFFAAVPIGLSAVLLEVKRVNCMGCLILPIMLRYFP
ncbi:MULTISPECIES: tripartite tricarboxylate transporter permease [unclassified Archaeoglobus]|jgi:putative membrane protein|uniref:tripartite tricarboxylate transporter permease n=1 Tax=unclassified Archaeoglobus TaxID=2643606 RepID=UPI0025B82049|nr:MULTISPECIES: tripartite tricarboxylate transporter permease [unclassified Archaeoglobus]